MASNKKKIFITESFSRAGRILLGERDDIEMVEFPNMISAGDFQAKLREHAPVHGVALGGTRFGETELEASGDMKVVTRIGVGFDAVDVPALSRAKVPLMVAGTANSPSGKVPLFFGGVGLLLIIRQPIKKATSAITAMIAMAVGVDTCFDISLLPPS